MKHLAAQAAMKTHLSQPIGAGAFDGQQGMSPVITSAVAGTDILSVDIDASDIMQAMADRATGAKARPTIMKIASSRRMAKLRFTDLISQKLATMESSPTIRYTTGFLSSRH
jgi:hypothetical protein